MNNSKDKRSKAGDRPSRLNGRVGNKRASLALTAAEVSRLGKVAKTLNLSVESVRGWYGTIRPYLTGEGFEARKKANDGRAKNAMTFAADRTLEGYRDVLQGLKEEQEREEVRSRLLVNEHAILLGYHLQAGLLAATWPVFAIKVLGTATPKDMEEMAVWAYFGGYRDWYLASYPEIPAAQALEKRWLRRALVDRDWVANPSVLARMFTEPDWRCANPRCRAKAKVGAEGNVAIDWVLAIEVPPMKGDGMVDGAGELSWWCSWKCLAKWSKEAGQDVNGKIKHVASERPTNGRRDTQPRTQCGSDEDVAL